MNNQISEEKKGSAIKILAIVGSIAVLLLGVWLAVQFVRVLPSAFSSLALLLESNERGRATETYMLESDKQVVNSGEPFMITWSLLPQEGTYRFSYACADGVSVDVRIEGETTEHIPCDDGFIIPEGVSSFEVIPFSEKARFIDVSYAVAFTKSGADEEFFEDSEHVTVVNSAIADADETPNAETSDDSEPDEPTESKPKPKPVPSPDPKPTTITTDISYIPQSDPRGFVDLKTTVLGTGELRGKTFTSKSIVDADDGAAIQIEVKNIGTKTSDNWDFEIELPNGQDFTLDENGLRPNERMVLTIEFNAEDLEGSERFEGSVDVDHDTNNGNNDFSGTMRFDD